MSKPVWIGLDDEVTEYLDAFCRAQFARVEAEAIPAEESARVIREWLGLTDTVTEEIIRHPIGDMGLGQMPDRERTKTEYDCEKS